VDPFLAVLPQFAEKQSGSAGPEAPWNPGASPPIPRDGQNVRVDLGRIAWVATVLACLVAVVILLLQGYYGYAIVTAAVAVSAAINLT
jgi:hypothetical protein